MILFYLILIILFLFSFMEVFEFPQIKRRFFSVFAFILILCFVGLKLPGISKDDYSYISSFEMINSFSEYFSNFSTFSFHEPGYHFLVVVFKLLFSKKYYIYFFLFAAIALVIKFIIFKRYSEYFFLTTLVYFAFMIPLHEMTQIRIAIGGGVIIYSWFLYSEGRFLLALLICLLSSLIHYSSLIGLIVFLLNNKKADFKYYILLSVIFMLGFSNGFDSKTFIINLNISGISDKVAAYKAAEESGLISIERINIFNIVYLSKIIFFIFLSIFSKNIPEKSWFHLFHKIFGVSLALFIFLSSDPTVAFRISEVLGLSMVFLLSALPLFVEEKSFAFFVVFLYCSVVLSINLFNDKLFTTYKFFFQT